MTFARAGTVCLRRLRADDLAAFQAYRNDPEVARYQGWTAMSDAEARGFLSAMQAVDGPLSAGEWTQIAVADAASDALLGDMGLWLSKDGDEAELGITLARGAQGQGRATQAVRLALDLVFAESEARHVWGIADLRNVASLALIERVGFVPQRDALTDGVRERFYLYMRPDQDR